MNLLVLFLVVLAISQTLTFPTSDDGGENSIPAGDEIFPSANSNSAERLGEILTTYTELLNQMEQRSGAQTKVIDEQENIINEQSYQTSVVINDHPIGMVHDQTDDVAQDQTTALCTDPATCNCSRYAFHSPLYVTINGRPCQVYGVPYCHGVCTSSYK